MNDTPFVLCALHARKPHSSLQLNYLYYGSYALLFHHPPLLKTENFHHFSSATPFQMAKSHRLRFWNITSNQSKICQSYIIFISLSSQYIQMKTLSPSLHGSFSLSRAHVCVFWHALTISVWSSSIIEHFSFPSIIYF